MRVCANGSNDKLVHESAFYNRLFDNLFHETRFREIIKINRDIIMEKSNQSNHCVVKFFKNIFIFDFAVM